MSGRVLRLAAAGLVLCALPRGLAAGYDECRPGSGSNKAKTLALFSVPLTFSQAAAPGRSKGITFGIEAANVPSVDPVTATPTICRPGKGPENSDLLAGIARPRLGASLPLGLASRPRGFPGPGARGQGRPDRSGPGPERGPDAEDDRRSPGACHARHDPRPGDLGIVRRWTTRPADASRARVGRRVSPNSPGSTPASAGRWPAAGCVGRGVRISPAAATVSGEFHQPVRQRRTHRGRGGPEPGRVLRRGRLAGRPAPRRDR